MTYTIEDGEVVLRTSDGVVLAEWSTPHYRLHHHDDGYDVDVCLGRDPLSPHRYTLKEVASNLATRSEALEALRRDGATEFYDWTRDDANWHMEPVKL